MTMVKMLNVSIFMADWQLQDDIKEAKNIINGDYDESIDGSNFLD